MSDGERRMANTKKSTKKSSRKRKKKRRALKIVLIVILLLLLGGATFAVSYLSNFKKLAQQNNKDLNTKTVQKNEPVNMLLVGVDIGDPKSKSKNDPKRTDTMMLVNYNPKSGNISVVSIPRDTMIRINGKNSKINDANAVGGINYAIDAVEKLLGVSINFYGKVDYNGFDKIIDAIGGVDMPINTRMDYDDPSQNLHIHFKKGTVAHLDGKKAEEFFRWRENNDGTGLAEGDIGRIKNQHLFIDTVISKFKSPSIITKVPEILTILPKYMETNMGATDIIKYGTLFSTTDKSKIKMYTLGGQGKYVGRVSYFIYDEEKSKDILEAISSDTSTSSSSNDDSRESSFNRDSVRVRILNCTSRNGIAASLSKIMKEKGYSEITAGNGIKSSRSKIIIYGNAKNYKDTIQDDFGIDNVQCSTAKSNYDIVVTLGGDYKAN